MVILFSSVGGLLVHFGLRKIPPLVGMIIFGVIAINSFGLADYPEDVADQLRQICLSVILMMGGLEITFKGQGITVLLLTICP